MAEGAGSLRRSSTATFEESATGRFAIEESHDLDHYRARPGNWDSKVTQLSREPFSSRVRSLQFDDLILYRNQLGGSCLLQGNTPRGWVMVGGIVAPERATLHWCGERVDRYRLGITSGSGREEVDYSIERGTETSVLLISPTLFRETLGEQAVDAVSRAHCLDFPDAGGQLVNLEGDLLERCEVEPLMLSQPAVAAAMRSALLRAVEECFSHLQMPSEPLSGNSREEVVYRAVQYVRSARQSVSAWGMARSAGVSQKTLESAFKQVMGITPGKYLAMDRLNAAHHELATSEKGEKTVTDIASAFGFTHMGRFSSSYKSLFGELPSQTLAQ